MRVGSRWIKRSAVVASAAAAVVAFAATPALAVSLSTTGASGRTAYLGNGDYTLYARDTLSDGHCAQWQYKEPGGSWRNAGGSVCSSSEAVGGYAHSGFQIHICRTGVWNCSEARTL